jgi:hypothetical protein
MNVTPTKSRDVRRELGPTAWVVLEELVAVSRRDDDGQLVSAVTAVGLAAALGIGRDAAVAALGRLRRHDLVVFVTDRQASTGRFGAGRYVVTRAAASVVSGLGALPAPDVAAEVSGDRRSRRKSFGGGSDGGRRGERGWWRGAGVAVRALGGCG